MASVSDTLIVVGSPTTGDVVATVTVTYDDATDDLIEVTVVCTITVTYTVYRANGSVWVSGEVPPGTYTFPPAGPVRRLSDLNRFTTAVEWAVV